MSDAVLLLGPVVFQDFEVPSGINFGGRQNLALHRLPGGPRVIDALGRDDAQIRFSGIFTGSTATTRARSLDEMRVAGIALPLTWDVFFYTVLIAEFRADYRNGWWIPYCITCLIVQDEASTLAQAALSLTTSVLGDIGMATSYASPAGLSLSPLQATLAAPGATTRGTAAYNAAQSSLGEAQTTIGTSIDAAEATLATVNLTLTPSSAQMGISGLLTACNSTGQLCSLVSASAFVRRASINLTNAST